jgi:hypothetical protein
VRDEERERAHERERERGERGERGVWGVGEEGGRERDREREDIQKQKKTVLRDQICLPALMENTLVYASLC